VENTLSVLSYMGGKGERRGATCTRESTAEKRKGENGDYEAVVYMNGRRGKKEKKEEKEKGPSFTVPNYLYSFNRASDSLSVLFTTERKREKEGVVRPFGRTSMGRLVRRRRCWRKKRGEREGTRDDP